MLFRRLANILLLSNLGVDKIWNTVTKIKLATSLEDSGSCGNDCLFSDTVKLTQVKAVEKELKIKPSEVTFKNMTRDDLKTAAEMFVYLNSCPGSGALKLWFKSWDSFYNDLFKYQSPDRIILTLNRIIKTKSNNEQIKNFKGKAQKLFKKISRHLLLEYEKIQNLIPAVESNSSSVDNVDIQLKKEGNNLIVYYINSLIIQCLMYF